MATDPCGNSTSVGFYLVYQDIYAPDIFHTPENIVLFCEDDIPAPASVLVIDDYTQNMEAVFSEEAVSTSFGTRLIRSWTATDECGNTSITEQHIDIYTNSLSCSIPFSGVLVCNSDNNTLSVAVSGGQAPYSYQWDMTDCDGFITDGTNTSTITYTVGYTTQNFAVTVTDANGCEQVCERSLSCDKPTDTGNDFRPQLSTKKEVNGINVYPVPTSEQLKVKLFKTDERPVSVSIVNLFGQVVYQTDHQQWPQEGIDIDTRQLPNGTYLLRVEQEGQMPLSREIVILH